MGRMQYSKKPKCLNTTAQSRAADLWEGTTWKEGHGKGHGNSQGTTHMEAVGIMNGSALIGVIHESSIKGRVTRLSLQTQHSRRMTQELWELCRGVRTGVIEAVPQDIRTVYNKGQIDR